MTSLSSVLEIVTATHPGMVRSHNEDSIAADAEIGRASCRERVLYRV